MISVIVNCYNSEKYIKRCIESVLNQTYKDLEIIIINDGSTDNTLKILKSYKDKRIKIVNTDNMGLSLARNKGIDNSHGDYLYFMDDDDYIEKDTIEYLYTIAKINKTKITTCNTYEVINDKVISNTIDDNSIEILDSIDVLKMVLLSIGRNGTIWNKLIHRSLFKNIRFENRIINDVVVVYKLLLNVDKVSYGSKYTYYYVRHDGSIIKRNNSDRAIDFYNASIERYKNIKKIYPDMIENDICLLSVITTIYQHNDKKVNKYLIEHDAKKYFKELFNFKVLNYKLPLSEKVKLILFRINPGLLVFTVSFYLKLKK